MTTKITTVSDLVAVRVREAQNDLAITSLAQPSLTYAGLYATVNRTKDSLRAMGIGRNDRVAVVLPNGPEMAAAFVAVSASASCAPLNAAYREKEFEFYLSDLGAKAIIVLRDANTPARTVAESLGMMVLELSSRSGSASGEFELHGVDAERPSSDDFAKAGDEALVLHTSGTTSRPKIVPMTQINICISAQNIQRTLELSRLDLCLNVMPLFHIHGLIGAILSSLGAGAGVVCTPGFDAVEFFDWMKQFQPTWYSAVPTMHQAVVAESKRKIGRVCATSFRFIRSSSSSLAPGLMKELEDTFGVPVIESYGMTEAAHQMSSNPLPPGKRIAGSVGLPAGPDVMILDEAGNPLPHDTTGEIAIQGDNVTAGYENNPTANKAAFADGWFRTGDLGYMNQDGYLFLRSRKKEMITRGGENISPREIDEVLLEHDTVEQAVAFAVPHSTLGEDVAAAVVLREGTDTNENELRRFAFDRLAAFKVPSRILKVTSIPKGPTGKLQRIGLFKALESEFRVQYVAPRNDLEKEIVAVFEQVLETSPIGATANFFAFGGDSLEAARVIAQLCSEYQVDLPAVSLFLNPSAEELGLEITRLLGKESGVLEELLNEIEHMSDEEVRRQSE